MPETADVVVIGGAVVGSAIAYALSHNPDFRGRVVVLEKDPSYQRAASSLSTSGIRQQFATAVNIKLSQYGVEFLRDAELHLGSPGEPSGIGFLENGYLLLGTAKAISDFEANNRLQRSFGVDAHLLGPDELARFPWLSLDDVAIGSFVGRGEGWFDGYLLLGGLKRRARARGVEYRQADVVGLLRAGDRVTGVVCRDGSQWAAAHVVNAAGASGPGIAAMAGITLPIRNIKQAVFNFESPVDGTGMPFTFFPDRVFFRPDGAGFIASIGIEDDPPDQTGDFEVDYAVFEEVVWPGLARHVPGFEQLRLKGGWAGHYDMNRFDHNAIVGCVPGVAGFYLANGFSGHGLMHSPGTGRALAELITYGEYRSIDLSELSFERLAANRAVRETIQY